MKKILLALGLVAMLAGPALASPAVLTPTIDRTTYTNLTIITWAANDGDDVGAPVNRDQCRRPLSVQIGTQDGDTHGSGTYVIQASNDPAANPDDADYASSVWTTLKDANGTALSRTTADLYGPLRDEAGPVWIRPSASGGTAADMDVVLVCGK
jgi:hypothetical protein